MIEAPVHEFALRVIARLREQIESITAYSHPFTKGGLVIVFRDNGGFVPDLISVVYGCEPPPVTLHCLRSTELFQLSFPGVFGWPNPLEEKPLLAYHLKFKGVVIYGRDIRDEIMLPDDPMSLLETQVQRCRQFVRNWALDQFRRRNYLGIIKEAERQIRYLLATALLTRNEWDVVLEEIPKRFELLFEDNSVTQTWKEINALAQHQAAANEASRESAKEAFWLFERAIYFIEGIYDDRDRERLQRCS
jgi:hypothetical protein